MKPIKIIRPSDTIVTVLSHLSDSIVKNGKQTRHNTICTNANRPM